MCKKRQTSWLKEQCCSFECIALWLLIQSSIYTTMICLTKLVLITFEQRYGGCVTLCAWVNIWVHSSSNWIVFCCSGPWTSETKRFFSRAMEERFDSTVALLRWRRKNENGVLQNDRTVSRAVRLRIKYTMINFARFQSPAMFLRGHVQVMTGNDKDDVSMGLRKETTVHCTVLGHCEGE